MALVEETRHAWSSRSAFLLATIGGAVGLGNLWRIADYGMHIYCNIPQLVEKTPLSPAGNPWSLPQNADSVYDYGKGACPVSDDLFARSVLITIPSRLTQEQEDQMTQAIKTAVQGATQ